MARDNDTSRSEFDRRERLPKVHTLLMRSSILACNFRSLFVFFFFFFARRGDHGYK